MFRQNKSKIKTQLILATILITGTPTFSLANTTNKCSHLFTEKSLNTIFTPAQSLFENINSKYKSSVSELESLIDNLQREVPFGVNQQTELIGVLDFSAKIAPETKQQFITQLNAHFSNRFNDRRNFLSLKIEDLKKFILFINFYPNVVDSFSFNYPLQAVTKLSPKNIEPRAMQASENTINLKHRSFTFKFDNWGITYELTANRTISFKKSDQVVNWPLTYKSKNPFDPKYDQIIKEASQSALSHLLLVSLGASASNVDGLAVSIPRIPLEINSLIAVASQIRTDQQNGIPVQMVITLSIQDKNGDPMSGDRIEYNIFMSRANNGDWTALGFLN